MSPQNQLHQNVVARKSVGACTEHALVTRICILDPLAKVVLCATTVHVGRTANRYSEIKCLLL
jgi:hypothetical protein